MSEVVGKPDDASIDAMNVTLRRMHATPPKQHKDTAPMSARRSTRGVSDAGAKRKNPSAIGGKRD